jgi:AsmA-like C-terminal region
MPIATAPPETTARVKSPRKYVFWGLLGVAALAGILLGLLAANWPFTQESIIKRLEQASSTRVEMRGFQKTFFPYPGCIAEEVTFRPIASASGPSPQTPVITIRRLAIESTFLGLFRNPGRIRSIVADGLRIHVPAGGADLHPVAGSKSDDVVIEELHAENALLELASRQPAGKPLVFQIHRVRFRNIGDGNKIPFEVSLHLPTPPGEVQSSGWLGPWKDEKGTVRSTPISGTYVLQRADLGVFKSIQGELSSHGQFSGNLEAINVAGDTDSPQFEVTESGHRFHLTTQFRGVVDLKNGDVTLPAVQARLGNTSLVASTSVAGKPKTVALNITQGKGEIQDLILLFSDSASPVTGPVSFHMKILLPAEHRPFKQRVQLNGNFVIDPAKFTSAESQSGIDQLSERANGKKDKGKDHDADDDAAGFDRVLTRLDGQVVLRNGVAAFSRISFSVPGAEGDMNGTYSILNKRVNLRGKMRMNATVSQATTGAKSFFLKIVDPFYKKHHAGAEVPITMTGVYGHTHFAAKLK